jgi:fructose-1,6-bisphosphatase/inositol monophosphatase family enzyme
VSSHALSLAVSLSGKAKGELATGFWHCDFKAAWPVVCEFGCFAFSRSLSPMSEVGRHAALDGRILQGFEDCICISGNKEYA